MQIAKLYDVNQRTDQLAQKIIDAVNNKTEHTVWLKACQNTPLISLGQLEITHHTDGEYTPSFMETIRSQRVFLLATTETPDKIVQLQLTIDAAKRGGAAEVVVVLPYYGYARQDRKDARPSHQRSSIGASVMALTIEALGANRVIVVELHAEQIMGMFRIPVDHVELSQVIANTIIHREDQTTDIMLCSPDAGGTKRVAKVQGLLGYLGVRVTSGYCSKLRDGDNNIANMTLMGNPKGRIVYLIDDMIDTAGTIVEAANLLLDAGAVSVSVIAAHGVLSGPARTRLVNSRIKDLYLANTLLLPYEDGECLPSVKESPKFHVMDISESVAGFIYSLLTGEAR